MDVIVDRIEGDFLVVELPNGDIINLPRVFAYNAKEGDIITISINKDATKERKDKVSNLVQELFID